MDEPEAYINAGRDRWGVYPVCSLTDDALWNYDPDLMRTAITDVPSSWGNDDFAFFAESYGPESPRWASEDHFAGTIVAEAIADPDKPPGVDEFCVYEILWWSIAKADIRNIDYAFYSPAGADATIAQCYFNNGNWCPIAWMRAQPVDKEISYGCASCINNLVQVIASAGGYLPSTEALSSDNFKDDPSEPIYPDGSRFWSAGSYPGMEDFTWFADAVAGYREFSYISLRSNLQTDSDYVYSLLRYDAFGYGTFGIFVANINDSTEYPTLQLDLLAAIEERLQYGIKNDSGEELPYYKFDGGLDAYSWAIFPGYSLPSWQNMGRINCYDYDGINDLDEGLEKTSLAYCLLYCLGDPEGLCDAVTVEWLSNGFVSCYKRSNIDFTTCTDTYYDEDTYSTFSVNF